MVEMSNSLDNGTIPFSKYFAAASWLRLFTSTNEDGSLVCLKINQIFSDMFMHIHDVVGLFLVEYILVQGTYRFKMVLTTSIFSG